MADTDTAPIPFSSIGGLPPSLGTVTDDTISPDDKQKQKYIDRERELISGKIGKEGAAEAEYERRTKSLESRMSQMVNAEGVTINDIKPWNAEEEHGKHSTGLWEAFGSPGFIISMLGSAFAARPMNAALQSGAAALNAIKQNDQEGYEDAFKSWKENTDLTIKRLDMEHKEFEDIDHLRKDNLEDWNTKMRSIMSRFGDERGLALLDAGLAPELDQAMSAKWSAKEQIQTAQNAIMEQKALSDSVISRNEKENPKHDPQKYLAILNEETAKMQQAKRAGIGGGANTLPREEAAAIAAKTDELRRADPSLSEADAIVQAATIVRPAFAPPVSQFNAQERARHDKVIEDLQSGRIDVSKARQDEIARHNQIIEDIDKGRLGAQYTKEEETARHDKAMEDIDGAKIKAQQERDESKNKTNPKWLASPEGQKWIKSLPEEDQPQYQAFVHQFAGGTDQKTVDETVKMIGEYRLPPLSGWVLKSDYGARVLSGLAEKFPDYQAARYWGGVSGQRAAGTRGGQIAVSAVEADRTFDLAEKASEGFPRGRFTPINRLRQMGAAATSDPNYRRFIDANEAAITAYSATMSRSGANSVHAQERADKVLSTADSPEAYKAGIDQLQMEVDAVRNAPAEASKELLDSLFGGGAVSQRNPSSSGWKIESVQ